MTDRHDTWVGGSLGKDQGRYENASDWAGRVAPQSGDTVTINGVANSGIGHIGPVITFPIGAGYTSVYLYEKPLPRQLQSYPKRLVGGVIAGQTLDLNGVRGAIELWLQHTTLGRGTTNVTGTTVMQSWLDNQILGAVNIGTAQGTGLLEINLSNFDTAGVGIPGQVTRVTLGGHTIVAAGSELKVESLAQGGGTVEDFVTNGTVSIGAGGTLLIDDTDGSGISTAAANNTAVVNTGTIQIEGGAGHTTVGTITASLVSTGTIEVSGNGAEIGSTKLTLNGNVTDQHIVLDDGMIAINDAELTIGDPSQAGFAVSGGSFTFGRDGGTLLLHQPPLTTLQFVDHDTKLEQRPDGQHPFTTPIYGFGQGDTIGLVKADVGGEYVTAWDATHNVLSVESPAATQGYPPEILATFTIEGSYAATGFHLQGDSHTQLLSLTYSGSHG